MTIDEIIRRLNELYENNRSYPEYIAMNSAQWVRLQNEQMEYNMPHDGLRSPFEGYLSRETIDGSARWVFAGIPLLITEGLLYDVMFLSETQLMPTVRIEPEMPLFSERNGYAEAVERVREMPVEEMERESRFSSIQAVINSARDWIGERIRGAEADVMIVDEIPEGVVADGPLARAVRENEEQQRMRGIGSFVNSTTPLTTSPITREDLEEAIEAMDANNRTTWAVPAPVVAHGESWVDRTGPRPQRPMPEPEPVEQPNYHLLLQEHV